MRGLDGVDCVRREIIRIRHSIHSFPELGNKEYKTAEFIENELRRIGIESERVLGTAVIGTLICNPGKTVGLRADMDALPITEETGCEYSSRNSGVMHACGHDVHIAAALGAAEILAKNRERVNGTIKFIFEPDEEGCGGAQRLVDTGHLDSVSAVFGAHVAPDLALGEVGIRYGKFYAASDVFSVKVYGLSSHAATPEKGKNALLGAAEMVVTLSNQYKGLTENKAVLTIGKITSGTACNIVADCAEFEGILRSLGNEDRERMYTFLKETVSEVANRFDLDYEVNIRKSYSGIENTEAETEIVEKTVTKTFGVEHKVILNEPVMTTEDFGVYVSNSAGCFYHLGAGCQEPLHSSRFLPSDEAAVNGAFVHANVLLSYLDV